MYAFCELFPRRYWFTEEEARVELCWKLEFDVGALFRLFLVSIILQGKGRDTYSLGGGGPVGAAALPGRYHEVKGRADCCAGAAHGSSVERVETLRWHEVLLALAGQSVTALAEVGACL